MKKIKIKFIKDHDAGIKKGEIKDVQAKFAKKMIDEEYAEKATVKEYDAYKADEAKKAKANSKKKMKAAEKANKAKADARKNDNGKIDASPKEQEDQDPEKELKWIVLDESDMDNKEYKDLEIEVGDELQVDGNGKPVLDVDGAPSIRKKADLGKSK